MMAIQSNEREAARLAGRIETFWRAKGYQGVKAWIINTSRQGLPYYVVRTNLVNGIPPGGRDEEYAEWLQASDTAVRLAAMSGSTSGRGSGNS